MLRLTEELAGRMRAQAGDAYPYECCGALLGVEGRDARDVRALLPLPNRREDSPENRYVIRPEDVRRAELAAREQGLELIGWYHSHPDSPPRPSEYDREHAWPWYSYIIISARASGTGEMASWRLSDDRSRFDLDELDAGVRARP